MARLNITLPDALYARLEQLRDRINLSKVCAIALEKEVTMLEGQPSITDPRIARLLQRLQSTRERWHQRGYEDGITWAVELATRDELQSVATKFAEINGQKLAELFRMQGKFVVAKQFGQPGTAHVFHKHPESGFAVSGFAVSQPAPPPPMPPVPSVPGKPGWLPGTEDVMFHQVGKPFPGVPESFNLAQRLQHWQEQDRQKSGEAVPGEATRVEIDESAYLEGWRDAIKGIWQTISPALS
jgi:ribosome modulation factor